LHVSTCRRRGSNQRLFTPLVIRSFSVPESLQSVGGR